MHGCEDIGPDYAVTLRAWREAWEEKKEQLLALGYSERFWRKYRFYCECTALCCRALGWATVMLGCGGPSHAVGAMACLNGWPSMRRQLE